MKTVKQVLRPERVRNTPEQFSWVDQALVQHHLIDRCSSHSAALYLFLVTVADCEGLSYYGSATLAGRLHLSETELAAARTELMALDLIAWQAPLYQVLALPSRCVPASPAMISACGQNLARMLETQAIPYMALDLDPDRVRQAAAAGQSVVFGDAARLKSLMAAGLARASAVVVTYHDTPSALKILQLVRSHAAQVPVVVRTVDDADLDKLRAAGAAEVVPEAIEGSLMLASHALALVGVPMRRVIRITRDARDARYGLLRGYFHGADDDTVEERHQARLTSVNAARRRMISRSSV